MNDAATPFSLVSQVSGALAMVILLIIACAWLARRCGVAGHARSGAAIVVKGSYSLGQRERLVIVDVEGQRLLLGVTPGAITRLGRLAPSDEAPVEAAPEFHATLRRLLKRGKAEPEQ